RNPAITSLEIIINMAEAETSVIEVNRSLRTLTQEYLKHLNSTKSESTLFILFDYDSSMKEFGANLRGLEFDSLLGISVQSDTGATEVLIPLNELQRSLMVSLVQAS